MFKYYVDWTGVLSLVTNDEIAQFFVCFCPRTQHSLVQLLSSLTGLKEWLGIQLPVISELLLQVDWSGSLRLRSAVP